MFNKIFNWLGSFNDPNTKRNLEYRADYYFNRIFFKRINSFYDDVNKQVLNNQITNSYTQFCPIEKVQFGDSFKSIQNLLGKHKFSYSNNNPDNLVQVLFYRIAIETYYSFVQFQFYNDKLYFIGIDNAKTMPTEKEKLLILNSILKNQLQTPVIKISDFKTVQDANENFIYLNDEINFSICFLDKQYLNNREQLSIALNSTSQ